MYHVYICRRSNSDSGQSQIRLVQSAEKRDESEIGLVIFSPI